MNLDRIKTLIDAMAASDLNEMEFSENGWSLKLTRRRHPGEADKTPTKAIVANGRQRAVRDDNGHVRLFCGRVGQTGRNIMLRDDEGREDWRLLQPRTGEQERRVSATRSPQSSPLATRDCRRGVIC